MSVAGVILAGGKATRMGGADKALVPLGPVPMVAHVIRRLSPQVDGLALNANGDPAHYSGFGLPVVPDTLPGQPGPLACLLAGMRWAAERGASQIVTAAADTPFLPDDLVPRLEAAAVGAGAPIALAETASGLHPTFGLWPVALADALDRALAEGSRKLASWALDQGAVRVRFDDRPVDPFFNVNTPGDLDEAGRLLAGAAR